MATGRIIRPKNEAGIPVPMAETTTDTYGPKPTNPIYLALGRRTGKVYEIKRKQWVLPFNRWAWEIRALGAKRAKYADTLAEAAEVVWPSSEEELNRLAVR
jgi:hypothetical protein